MRKINKSTPLAHFNGKCYKDCFDWDCFKSRYYDIFSEARFKILTEEQNQLCGYTEIYIGDDEESHIDHYIKRADNNRLTFEWNNLVVAIADNDFGANFKDNKCHGKNKGITEEEYSDIYNPVTDDITFEYDEWGAIIEQEGKIKKTVEVFNLNCESLKRRRADIITTTRALKNAGELEEDIRSSLKDTGFVSVLEHELRN